MTRAAVYLPENAQAPGRLAEVQLEVAERGRDYLRLADVSVLDEGADGIPETGDLAFDPAGGGGPMAGQRAQREARAFGIVNTAFHAQRALGFAQTVLGRPLPHLLIRIGMHQQHGCWGGGHYRLPAANYSELPEAGPIRATGEVHLGSGKRYLPSPAPRYFHMPGHNAAIICHEVGHHVCRHTADFRLNRLLPGSAQTNRKIALDEGTADYITAVLLDNADIYGWHRSSVPEWRIDRRRLSARWTMAEFRGGKHADPHRDGTIWASALWSARAAVRTSGIAPGRFDAMVLRGLDRIGSARLAAGRTNQALRERRYFSRLLESMLAVDPGLEPVVSEAMHAHGITVGASNAALRDSARACLDALGVGS